jgi:hypothetical protein
MSFESKKYWFKSKEYGMVWTPARPIGWVVLVLHGAFAIIAAVYAEKTAIMYESPEKFFILIAATIALLLTICWRTGEPLKWRRGNKK